MYSLINTIDEDTYVISDTHFGHWKILTYVPERLNQLLRWKPSLSTKVSDFMELQEKAKVQLDPITYDKYVVLGNELIAEFDNITIEYINDIVNGGTLLHLGDFAFRGVKEYSERLKCKKILLLGNHDKKPADYFRDAGWDCVVDTSVIGTNTNELITHPYKEHKFVGNYNGKLSETAYASVSITKQVGETVCCFSHYPIFDNNPYDTKFVGIKEDIRDIYDEYNAHCNIHGHIHDSAYNPIDDKISINCSVEGIDFKPKKLKEILRVV